MLATVPASPGRDTNAGRRCCAAHAATAEEKLCCVVLDYDSELKHTAESSDKEKTYELPDGNINTVDDKYFRCSKVPFQPNSSVRPSKSTTRTSCCTMFQVIGERMAEEITALAPSTVESRWWLHQCESFR